MRPADARLSASVITRISIRLSLVGAHVDWRMNMSRPRTFSSSSTITSPSENWPTTHRPRLMLRCRQTASASFGFALPVKTLIRSKAMANLCCDYGAGAGARTPQLPVEEWLGRKDSNLRMPESKSDKAINPESPMIDNDNAISGLLFPRSLPLFSFSRLRVAPMAQGTSINGSRGHDDQYHGARCAARPSA